MLITNTGGNMDMVKTMSEVSKTLVHFKKNMFSKDSESSGSKS